MSNEQGLPWYVWLVILIACVWLLGSPFYAIGAKDGTHMADTLKTNRVYVSQEVFEKFKRDNK